MAVTASISLSENSYSVANNTSSVTCKVTVKWTYGSYDHNKLTKTLTLNGTKYTTTTNVNPNNTTSGSATFFNKTVTVAHASDGTKTVSASVSIPTRTSSGTVTASKSLKLTNIPRYATCSQSVYSKNETQITMKWSSDSTIDYVWYSINGGSSWVAIGNPASTSGSYTITGLSVGATYSIKTRVRRKDSQLTTDSAALSVATYAYPYANSMPNFTLGNNFTIGIYNPLGRTYYITFIGADNTEYPVSTAYTQTSLTFSSSGINDWLYSTIPNAKNGTYKVKITYGSSVQTRTGGTYSVNTADASPSFTSGTYQDTNQTVTAITGDNQDVIPTKSILQFDMSGMTSRLYASISSAYVTLNNTNYAMTISGSTATVSNVPLNSSGQNATMTVTDSRGLTYSQIVVLDTIDYSNPSISATAERDAGFYSATDVTPTVNYTYIGSNGVTINLKARKVGTTAYTVDQTIPDGQTSRVTLNNESAWEILLTATDSFGGSGTYNITIARGLPLMYFDTELLSVSMNKFPEHSEAFEVAGDIFMTLDQTATSGTDYELIQALTNIGWSDLI